MSYLTDIQEAFRKAFLFVDESRKEYDGLVPLTLFSSLRDLLKAIHYAYIEACAHGEVRWGMPKRGPSDNTPMAQYAVERAYRELLEIQDYIWAKESVKQYLIPVLEAENELLGGEGVSAMSRETMFERMGDLPSEFGTFRTEISNSVRVANDLHAALRLPQEHDTVAEYEAAYNPNDSGAGDNGAENIGIKPSHEKAYRLFEYATSENPSLTTDREVYEWLATNSDHSEHLPERYSTFTSYLTKARRHYKTSKHTFRSGRPSGRNIVREDQI